VAAQAADNGQECRPVASVTVDGMKELVGQELGLSDWMTIDQAMIDKFADATNDHQFIHVDPERARMTPFGGTIAHGFLTLSLYPALREKADCPQIDGILMALNYGGNKVRFLAPVRSGSRVRGRFKLLDFVDKGPRRYQETTEFTVEIEGQDKPALVAEWIAQIYV
jgi:acyl dehydratase